MIDLFLAEQLLISKAPAKENNGGADNKENIQKNPEQVVDDTVAGIKRLTVGVKKVLGSTNTRTTCVVKPELKKSEVPQKKVVQIPEKPQVKTFKARPLPKYILEKKKHDANFGLVARAASAPVKAAPVKPMQPPRREVTTRKPAPIRISTSAPAVPTRISNARRTIVVPDKQPQTSKALEKKSFAAKVPAYLYREPFKPTHEKKIIEPKPFKLSKNTRHQIDEERRRANAARNKKIEEDKRKKEEEELKKMRKQREFKARANPFQKVIKKSVNDEPKKK